jgi:hypothetical protein
MVMRVPTHPTLIRRMLDARLKQLATTKPVLAASLVQTAKHCGRPSCRCLNGGPKHVGNYVTCKIANKTRTVYVPLDLVEEVRSWIDEQRRIKRLLQEVQLLSLALIRNHARHRDQRRGRP